MKATILLRVASVLAAVQAVAHTVEGVFGTPPSGPGAAAVLAMQANHFQVMGLDRTYYQFFMGFGLAITLSLMVESVLFWMLGEMVRNNGAFLRPLLVLYSLTYLGVTVIAGLFIFPPPMIVDALIAILLAWAALSLKPVGTAVVGA